MLMTLTLTSHSPPIQVTGKTTTTTTHNKDLVQITASNEEIQRRIAAFCEHMRSEINENNQREYCNVFAPSQSSCARTDAVFVPRVGYTGHVKVSRVTNPYGPQTARVSPSKRDIGDDTSIDASRIVAERLKNIESHLSIKGDCQEKETSQLDINKRLKRAEERILFLEGLSPEYFTAMPQMKREKAHQTPTVTEDGERHIGIKRDDDDMSLADIDEQMNVLRQKLHGIRR